MALVNNTTVAWLLSLTFSFWLRGAVPFRLQAVGNRLRALRGCPRGDHFLPACRRAALRLGSLSEGEERAS